MNDTTYTAVISRVTRMNNSANGNPSWVIHFEGGHTARTQTDAAVNHGLDNPENIGVPVKITVSRAGRVVYVVPINEEK